MLYPFKVAMIAYAVTCIFLIASFIINVVCIRNVTGVAEEKALLKKKARRYMIPAVICCIMAILVMLMFAGYYWLLVATIE